MSSIDERIREKGNFSYRVRIRQQGLRQLYLTFRDKEQAIKWLEEHEECYLENPEPYIRWLEANRKSIKENGIYHTHIPLSEFK